MNYYSRGHLVLVNEDGLGYYADTGEIAAGIERPCPLCHKMPTPEGYDACLGHIPGARSACCGHGVELGYVVMGDYQPNEWIKVADKLPEQADSYLVAYQERDYSKLDPEARSWYIYVGFYRYPGQNFWLIDGEPNIKVAHWMPFPEPPSER